MNLYQKKCSFNVSPRAENNTDVFVDGRLDNIAGGDKVSLFSHSIQDDLKRIYDYPKSDDGIQDYPIFMGLDSVEPGRFHNLLGATGLLRLDDVNILTKEVKKRRLFT